MDSEATDEQHYHRLLEILKPSPNRESEDSEPKDGSNLLLTTFTYSQDPILQNQHYYSPFRFPWSSTTTSNSNNHLRSLLVTTATFIIRLLPYVPPLISIIIASLAVGAPPLHFNIRNLVIVFGILGSWTTSHVLGMLITWLLVSRNSSSNTKSGQRDGGRMPGRDSSRSERETEKKKNKKKKMQRLAFWLTTLKNVVFAPLPVVLLGMMTCGAFSTCEGWAPIEGLELRKGGLKYGSVVLDGEKEFERNLNVYYPRLVGAGLGMQVGFGLMLVLVFGGGLGVVET